LGLVSGVVAALSSAVVALSGASVPAARRWESVSGAGDEGGGEVVRGGGGSGALWASPCRRRVRVSWALVGTPLRRVLWIES
jgi:hypothetical protein